MKSKIYVILLSIVFLLSVVSAFEFDNVKNYDSVKKEVTFKNSLLGFPTTSIGTAQLNTPHFNKVGLGYNEVAVITICSVGEYQDVLKGIDFYNKSEPDWQNHPINKSYDLKLKKISYKDVTIKGEKCDSDKTLKDINKLNASCIQTQDETFKQKIVEYEKVDKIDFVKEGCQTFSIFTDVKKGEYVEFIPHIYGLKIEEWASWSADLNTGLISYYKLDDESGLLIDALGFSNMTVTGTINYTEPGIINYSVDSDSDGYAEGSTSLGISGTDTRSVSFWIYPENVSSGGNRFLFGWGSGANPFGAYIGFNSAYLTAWGGTSNIYLLSANTWYHIVMTYDGGTWRTYVNGNLEDENLIALNTGTTTPQFTIFENFGDHFTNYDGLMDEIGIWNRELNSTEVTLLYNNGSGITVNQSEVNFPSIIFNSPESTNYDTSPQTITFNFTAYDAVNLTEVNLYVNDILNQTNASGVNNSDYIFNLTVGEGTFEVYATAVNNNSLTNTTETRTFIIDATAPIVNITSPSDPYTVTQFNESVQINWSVLDVSPDTCWYILNNDEPNVVNIAAGSGSRYYDLDGNGEDDIEFIDVIFGANEVRIKGFNSSVGVTTNQSSVLDCNTASYNLGGAFGNASAWIDDNYFCVNLSQGEKYLLRMRSGNEPASKAINFTSYEEPLSEIVSCSLNTTTVNYPSSNPDNATFYLFANDTLGNENNDSLLLVKSTDVPNITILYPQTSFVTLESGDSIDLNYSITNSTPLQTCWYEYNSINTTITCNQNTSFSYVAGQDEITLYANTTLGNENYNSASWSILVSLSSINYTDITYETKREYFSINVTANTSVDSINGIFVYNGTNYSTTQTLIGNITNLIAQIDIPLFNETINTSLYFIINATSSSVSSLGSSKPVNQTVQNITLFYCEGNYTANYINYTTKSATNPYPEVNTTFSSNWNYYLSSGGGTVVKVLGYQDLNEDTSQYNFCFSRPDLPIIVTNEIEVNANGYSESSSFLNDATLSNDTTEQDIFLLNESISFATVLEVYDQNGFPITDVTISALLYDVTNDTYFTVTQGITSTIGTTLVYLNWLDSTYKFVLVKNGEILQTTLPEVLYESPRVFTITEDFTYTYNKFLDIPYTLTFNNVTHIFSLTFANPTGAYNEACLRVNKKAISGDTVICDTCQTASSGTITCNVDAYGNGTYQATFYATGSLQSIDWLVEVIGNDYSRTIAETIGNEDATLYAFLMGVMITGIMFVSPVLGIIGIIISVYISYLMGFILLDYIVLSSLIIIGGVIALIFNK